MDALDQQLISLLHTNARTSLAELAHQLKVSRGTVSNRMRKLETQGLIVGYTVQLKPHNQPTHITAWMSIQVEGNDNRRLVANLLGEPSINALHGTNGRWDLLAELKADNLAALSEALERIRLIKGIVNTETSIHLSGYKG